MKFRLLIIFLVLLLAVFASGCISIEKQRIKDALPSEEQVSNVFDTGDLENSNETEQLIDDGKCTSNLGCDDNEPCTTDICLDNGDCKHTIVPGCELVERPEKNTVIISEIQSNSNLNKEFIRLTGTQLLMEGYNLSDEDGHSFIFPEDFYISGQIRIYSGSGLSASKTSYYWGSKDQIWDRPGEIATLKDSTGKVVDTFIVPNDN